MARFIGESGLRPEAYDRRAGFGDCYFASTGVAFGGTVWAKQQAQLICQPTNLDCPVGTGSVP